MNQLLDKVLRYLRARVALSNLPRDASRILDVGCGPKPWFLYRDADFLKRFDITTIDQIPYKFRENPGFKFVQTDIEKSLPFPDSSFDVITMLAVIEHMVEPERILREIHRTLKPGGTLIITTPSPASKRILEFLAFKLGLIGKPGIADHKNYFDNAQLKSMLNHTGFKVEKLQSFELGFNIFAEAKK